MPPFSAKKRYQALSIKKKLAILEEVDKKQKSKTEIALDFGIPKSTLSTIIKGRKKIAKARSDGVLSDRKKLRTAAFPKLEDALIAWIKKLRTRNLPVDGNLLKAKAEEFAIRMGIEGKLKFSEGWIQSFKKRYNLTFKKVCGESGDANLEVAKNWQENRLKRILADYNPEDVFNADETGLFYKLLPNRTFSFKNEHCTGGKLSKLRITIMLAANMTGSEKLKLMVIGKSAKPRCFRGIKCLPVNYTSNKKAWMTEALFENWIRQLDRKFAIKNRKVLLIVDNCSAHSHINDLSAIKLEFLPPNLTSVIQPLDQGVIQSFKKHYRKSLLQRMLIAVDNDQEYSVSLLSAIYLAAAAWDSVTAETIKNCFRHAGFFLETTPPPALTGESSSASGSQPIGEPASESCDDAGAEGETILQTLRSKSRDEFHENLSFLEYVEADTRVESCQEISDEDILNRSLHNTNIDSSDEEPAEEENNVLPVKRPTTRQAIEALDQLKRFFEAQDRCEDFLHMTMVMEKKVLACASNTQQTKITDFFLLPKTD